MTPHVLSLVVLDMYSAWVCVRFGTEDSSISISVAGDALHPQTVITSKITINSTIILFTKNSSLFMIPMQIFLQTLVIALPMEIQFFRF